MSGSLKYYLANRLWLASGLARTRAFNRALNDPRAAQQTRLFSLLRGNARSQYGRRYGFERIKTIDDYQAAVPMVSYEALEDEIAAIKRGRQGILTEEPVTWMEKTTGSSGTSKYIPCTAGLQREFQAAVAPWMADLYRGQPRLKFGASYWSITPLAETREVTEGGIPVGCADEREYFSALDRRLLDVLILTPRQLAEVMDIDAARYITLRFLIATPHLTFISVWNPSFLTLLIRFLERNAERLIADVREGTLTPPVKLPPPLHKALSHRLVPERRRAARLEALFGKHGKLVSAGIWPNLRLISCWASANARGFLPELQELFPGVEIQPKGLLATEGVVSVPMLGHPGGAPALTSHFLEFIPAGSSHPVLADELEAGEIYKVVMTTGGGLYRYFLGDLVQVVGRVAATPLLEFIGRDGHVADLCGEKLHGSRIETVLHEALHQLRITPSFAMIAPELGDPPRYFLFIDDAELPQAACDRLIQRVELGLSEGHHYAYCRRLGQLGPLGAVRVQDGARKYLERCAALGQRLGGIKPAALHGATGWLNWFQAAAGKPGEPHEPLRL